MLRTGDPLLEHPRSRQKHVILYIYVVLPNQSVGNKLVAFVVVESTVEVLLTMKTMAGMTKCIVAELFLLCQLHLYTIQTRVG